MGGRESQCAKVSGVGAFARIEARWADPLAEGAARRRDGFEVRVWQHQVARQLTARPRLAILLRLILIPALGCSPPNSRPAIGRSTLMAIAHATLASSQPGRYRCEQIVAAGGKRDPTETFGHLRGTRNRSAR